MYVTLMSPLTCVKLGVPSRIGANLSAVIPGPEPGMTADRYARSPRVAHSEQEHRLSLRAELVRLGLRWFVKRWSSRKSTVAAMRRRVAVLGLLVPLPPMGT